MAAVVLTSSYFKNLHGFTHMSTSTLLLSVEGELKPLKIVPSKKNLFCHYPFIFDNFYTLATRNNNFNVLLMESSLIERDKATLSLKVSYIK